MLSNGLITITGCGARDVLRGSGGAGSSCFPSRPNQSPIRRLGPQVGHLDTAPPPESLDLTTQAFSCAPPDPLFQTDAPAKSLVAGKRNDSEAETGWGMKKTNIQGQPHLSNLWDFCPILRIFHCRSKGHLSIIGVLACCLGPSRASALGICAACSLNC